MNMLFQFIDSVRSKENKKRRFALTLVLLLLGSIAGYFVWTKYRNENPILPPLTEEEQQLVGEWKFESDGITLSCDYGYTFLPDHICIKRWYEKDTNLISYENRDQHWWFEGGRLTIRAKHGAFKEMLSIGTWKWNRPLKHDSIYDLIPEGPGHFRTEESVRIEGAIETPRATGTGKMTRIERKDE